MLSRLRQSILTLFIGLDLFKSMIEVIPPFFWKCGGRDGFRQHFGVTLICRIKPGYVGNFQALRIRTD